MNPNEPERKPACLRPSDANLASCDCPVCVCRESRRAEAAARAPETATEYCARELAEILAARRASNDESDRLQAFLRDCGCPCCSARRRLRALSYDRAYGSTSSIHCASTDRRDDNKDAARLEAFARAGRYAENSDKAIRAATERLRENTDTGPARAD